MIGESAMSYLTTVLDYDLQEVARGSAKLGTISGEYYLDRRHP